MRFAQFHETWNGSQISAQRWLTAYTAYYNHSPNHQALDNTPPIKFVTVIRRIDRYFCPDEMHNHVEWLENWL